MPRRDAERMLAGDATVTRCTQHRVAVGGLLIALLGANGCAAFAALASPLGPTPRSQPLDLDYRLEGTTSLVLQVFDDGEAVHIQPAAGTRLALAGPGGLSRTRGPYLVLPQLPARFVLVDSTDPARRVEITHRRRALDAPSDAHDAESRGLHGACAGAQRTAPGADRALRAPAPVVRIAAVGDPKTAGESPSPAAVDAPAGAVQSADVPAGATPLGVPRQGANAQRVEPAVATVDVSTGEPSSRRGQTGQAVPPAAERSPAPAARPAAPPLVFVARASVQATLRSWLAAQGLDVEFIGVPTLRVEEDARVQQQDLRATVGEALGRLGLRGEWIDKRLRVTPERGPW